MTRTFWKRLFLFVLGDFFLNVPEGLADQPHPWQVTFQTPATAIMEKINDFHNTLLVLIFSVAVFVGILLLYVIIRFNKKRNPIPSKTTHHTLLEVVWTLIPACIVVGLMIPSMKALYFMSVIPESEMTIKITGHQWYWEYTYPDHGGFTYESRLIEDKDLKPEDLRLLAVDNPLVIPVGSVIRLQGTSQDVIHSWAVPAFGIKKDTVPGKLNEYWIKVEKEGTYYGQCSELCGPQHGFMPIMVKVVSQEAFKAWVEEAKKKYAVNTYHFFFSSFLS